jgi:hypothetical protein
MAAPSLEQQAQKLLRHPAGSIDALFLTRALRAFEDLTRELPQDALSAAAAAPSDLEVVLRAMIAAGEQLTRIERKRDPLALARLRGQQARLALLSAEGGTLSAGQVADLLGVSRQAVNKRRQAGRLLALPLGRHGFAYPAWQFTGDDVLAGLATILEKLADHDPWMQARFFLSASKRLDEGRPLDELRRGNVATVIAAAAAYGEHGAA